MLKSVANKNQTRAAAEFFELTNALMGAPFHPNVGQTSGLPVQGDSVSLNSSSGLQRKPKPADRRSAPHTGGQPE